MLILSLNYHQNCLHLFYMLMGKQYFIITIYIAIVQEEGGVTPANRGKYLHLYTFIVTLDAIYTQQNKKNGSCYSTYGTSFLHFKFLLDVTSKRKSLPLKASMTMITSLILIYFY